MADSLDWTLGETGLDDGALDPLVAREFGIWDVYDADPCPWCREPSCERSCTGALLADAGEDEA